jgi:hypothetical protein
MDDKDTQDKAIVTPDTDKFFIRNIKSIIEHKIANCKIVDPSLKTNKDAVDQKRKELAKYFNNVILQINKNLNKLVTFLKYDSSKQEFIGDGKNKLLSNAEYTFEQKNLKGETPTYVRSYNNFFKEYMNEKLKYIRGYNIYGETNEGIEYVSTSVTIPTKGETQRFDDFIIESKKNYIKEYEIVHGKDSWRDEKKMNEEFINKMMEEFSKKKNPKNFNFKILEEITINLL